MRNPKPTVLIVDDEPDILLMLRLNLEAEGFETLLASDGQTALRRVREEHPDLVLLDVMMPLLDGWGVLEELATFEPRPRVVVLTAKNTERDLEKATELGADSYMTKPFDPTELLETIDTVLSSSRSDRNDEIEAVYVPDANPEPPGSGSDGVSLP